MKIRNGFVSNSSSSSFIVISSDNNFNDIPIIKHNILGEKGKKYFSWENETSNDFYSKVNWSYMQAKYANNKDWLKMLTKVIREVCNVKGRIKWNIDIQVDSAIIDHQSTVCETESNGDMFASEDILKKFLFNSDSYIQTGNDNE